VHTTTDWLPSIFLAKGRQIGTAKVHSFLQIFVQGQLRSSDLINSSNLSTFDQTVTDLPGSV